MFWTRSFAVVGLVVGLSGIPCLGQSLQTVLDDSAVGSRWIYNDWNAAQVAARDTGKPILALFR